MSTLLLLLLLLLLLTSHTQTIISLDSVDSGQHTSPVNIPPFVPSPTVTIITYPHFESSNRIFCRLNGFDPFVELSIFIFDFFASRMVNHVALGDLWCCAGDCGSSAREGEQSEHGFVDFGAIENTTT